MEPLSPPKRSLARYIAALLNRCPGWVAALQETLPEVQLMACSPSGAVYAFHLRLQGPVDEPLVDGLRGVLAPGQRGVVVCRTGEYTAAALERAREHEILPWSLEQLDYLILAAELEMNAPLAYAGLEVEVPKPYLPETEQPVPGIQVLHV
jgi:hypothetical protein